MKKINYLLILLLSLAFVSCSDDKNDDIQDFDSEVEDLIKVQQITNENHIIEIFSTSGKLYQGYNKLTLRVVDKTTQDFITNAAISWKPVMHMTQMMHSCPYSTIAKVSGMKTIYEGEVIFQMPGNATEGWRITIDYSIDGMDYTVEDNISVMASENRVVSVFNGTDGLRYVLALIAPEDPEVKINEMSAGLYKMENMMTFSPVAGYTINLDPRMPSMGNHTSPNNENLVYDAGAGIYKGKLSLTMTGYWILNLQLINQNNEILKGEEVTEENESSSLYFEIEF